MTEYKYTSVLSYVNYISFTDIPTGQYFNNNVDIDLTTPFGFKTVEYSSILNDENNTRISKRHNEHKKEIEERLSIDEDFLHAVSQRK